MKVERREKDLANFTAPAKIKLNEVKTASQPSFEQELNYHQKAAVQIRMQELLKEIDRLSGRLARNINLNELMIYKRLIKDFLLEASNQAYSLCKIRGRNRRGRIILVTIKTIDQELENLINDFRTKKSEPINILEQLDKIRGLLVDLMI